jgi:hypothetical protein
MGLATLWATFLQTYLVTLRWTHELNFFKLFFRQNEEKNAIWKSLLCRDLPQIKLGLIFDSFRKKNKKKFYVFFVEKKIFFHVFKQHYVQLGVPEFQVAATFILPIRKLGRKKNS